MIDLKKKYKTRDGRDVILHDIVEFNSCGNRVTYPVKGSIVNKKVYTKLQFSIWSKDGFADVVWNKNSHNRDLIEVNP